MSSPALAAAAAFTTALHQQQQQQQQHHPNSLAQPLRVFVFLLFGEK